MGGYALTATASSERSTDAGSGSPPGGPLSEFGTGTEDAERFFVTSFEAGLDERGAMANDQSWAQDYGPCCDGSTLDQRLYTWDEAQSGEPNRGLPTDTMESTDYTRDFHDNLNGNMMIQESGGYGNFTGTYSFSDHSSRHPDAPFTPDEMVLAVGGNDHESGFPGSGDFQLIDRSGRAFLRLDFPCEDGTGGLVANDSRTVTSDRNNGLYAVALTNVDWASETYDLTVRQQVETGWVEDPIFSESMSFHESASDMDGVRMHAESSVMVYLGYMDMRRETGSSDLTATIRQIRADDFPEIDTFCSVRDGAGNPVTGLTGSNFALTEDGADQTIDSVSTVGSASDVRSALVIDRSGSMGGGKLDDAKAGARAFVDNLQPGDEAAVVAFDDDVSVVQDFTGNTSTLDAAINSLSAGGSTALFDAVEEAIALTAPTSGRQAIVVLADGDDNADPDGDGSTLDDVIRQANSAGISVYAIGLVTDDYDATNLQRLARETGGLFFEAPDSGDLTTIYEDISRSIESEYVLTYDTTNDVADGTERTVACTVTYEGNSAEDTGTYTAPNDAGGDGVDIQTIDPDEYPLVCTYLQIDTPTGRNGEITDDLVTITENGDDRTIRDLRHLGDDSTSAIDVSFVFDDTGSMDDEIADMKARVRDFASTLESEGFDARYSLVSFKDDVELDQRFTSDLDTFQSAVDDLSASGGDDRPEDNFDALETALALDYRPGAEQVIVDITDSVAHYEGDGSGYTDWTMAEMTDRLLSEGVTYVAVAPSTSELGNERNSKQVLAENVGGLWIDVRSADFSDILEAIGGELTEGRYVICFESPLPCDDVVRNVRCVVDDPDRGRLRDLGEYIPPVGCRGGGDDEVTACLGPLEVPLEARSEVCVTLGDFDNGLSGCEFQFEFPDFVDPVGATANDEFGLREATVDGQTVTIRVTDTDDEFQGTIDSLELGCITVRGLEETSGLVTVDPIQVDDDDGFPVDRVDVSRDCREISVLPAPSCPTVDGVATTDPDGDGLCEDLNGNDRTDYDDVVELFEHLSDSDVEDNVDAFDFNGNDRIDYDDVVTLFDEIS